MVGCGGFGAAKAGAAIMVRAAAKEPAIVAFLKARVALPLFFERALIEITPRRSFYWADGDPLAAGPDVALVGTEAG